MDELNVNLGMDMADFGGVFANVFQVFTDGEESRIDCVYVDKTSRDEQGSVTGKVVSRITMTTSSLIALRNLLDSHLAGMSSGE